MYQPNPTDLQKLGFRPALSTGGIWKHEESGLWIVLLLPLDFALSTEQYSAGTRYSCAETSKESFYHLLLDAGMKPLKQSKRQAA